MPLRINFALSEGLDTSPIPAGVYPVVVTDAEVVEDTPSGYPYIRFTLTVSEGEYKGRKLWYRASTHPKAMEFTRNDLIVLGVPEDQIAGDVEVEIDERDLIGAECYAVVTQESYQGEMRNRVESLRSTSVKRPQPQARPASGSTGDVQPKKAARRVVE